MSRPGVDSNLQRDGFAVNTPEMGFDLGDGTGCGLFASGAGVFRFHGVVADRAEGENKPALAVVINQRGDFFVGIRRTGLDVVHKGATARQAA